MDNNPISKHENINYWTICLKTLIVTITALLITFLILISLELQGLFKFAKVQTEWFVLATIGIFLTNLFLEVYRAIKS